jgi:hypothetical protein
MTSTDEVARVCLAEVIDAGLKGRLPEGEAPSET